MYIYFEESFSSLPELLVVYDVAGIKQSTIWSLKEIVLVIVYYSIYSGCILKRITQCFSQLTIQLIIISSAIVSICRTLTLSAVTATLAVLIPDHGLLEQMSIAVLNKSNQLLKVLFEIENFK